MPEAPSPQRLRCDPFLAVAWRATWLWGAAAIAWHFGTQWTPWHQQVDWWQVLGAVAMFGWGLWHLLAWYASSIEVDRAAGIVTLRRLNWQGGEDRVIGLSAIRAVALVPQSGPGRYVLPPATIEDMYRPHRFGRTASGALEVMERR